MKVIQTIAEMRKLRQRLLEPVGFVPTMGYLHEGHLTLVRKAKEKNASAVVSIFVNPTQFGPQEDFEKYPRDTERDLAMLKTAKTDAVFMPSAEEMYPANSVTWVDVKKITEHLEGAARPGHFRGVATVVAKLFNIVQPDRAYFGQKDAQQVLVVKRMVADLNMNIEVIAVPTVREPDGLAMSSRNIYLNPEQRKAATVLYRALNHVLELWSEGERNPARLRRHMLDVLRSEPLAVVEYVSVADPETLEEMETAKPGGLVSMAVRVGKTRLIDNMVLELKPRLLPD
ncbi:MAG: pantoate--beta-alanine ligase [Chloroflexi bacterium]|nr:pantoate--beta-alanine ligase [Chloroflexota bacterium]